jgi:NAD(P)-dependent dehydrogenase (short-subunit alcohol dehydrogenase family)
MRHAVITGGSRGIGLAVAAELDAHGWGVFLVSQHPESLAVASAQMKNLAGTLAIDLGNGEAAARDVHAAVARVLDSVDLLVLNAGIFVEEQLTAIREQIFRQNMAVNLDAICF